MPTSVATADAVPAARRARGSWQTTRVAALKLPSLPFPLEPAGSPPPGCHVRRGALILSAAAGTDMFVDPAGADPGQVPDAGRFVGLPPAGDFTLAAQVRVEFGSMYDAGALLLHARERHWAKVALEYSPQQRPTAVTVVTRGVSDDCNSFEVDGDTLWLRITRSGAAWAFHASADGSVAAAALLRPRRGPGRTGPGRLPGSVAGRRGLHRHLRPHLLPARRPEEPP